MKSVSSMLRFGMIIPAACGEPQREPLVDADTIFHNGKVITLYSASTIASAAAIKGDRIIAVGGGELLELYAAGHTLDLQGRTLLPGFVILGTVPGTVPMG